MLIVFRTNSSNNRYWEGRSHWSMMLNTCRNLVRMGAVYAGSADNLARLVTAYVLAVKEHLRGGRNQGALRPFLSGRVLEQLGKAANPPALLARWLSRWVDRRLLEERLNKDQGKEMERLICLLLDCQGGCEKIVRTPLPFVYAALIKQLLLLYLVSLPFVLVARMGFAAPLVVAVVSLGLLGIEEAGVEIESPFGLDPNHLPLEEICETIARDVKEMAAAEDD